MIVSSERPNQGPYIGAMLRPCWQWVREQIYAGVLTAGYDDLNPAHVGLFRYPTLDRQRPSELADQLQITRQSVNDLLGHLEQRGYITRETDTTDGRARVVRLTAKGRRLQKTIGAEALRAEREIATLLGPRQFAQLRSALEHLAREIGRNNDIPATSDP